MSNLFFFSFSFVAGKCCRLWAEVFHVSTSSAGTVRWQQISEDLVPVNISCIQDQPDYVFHITAYNSQVDKILDVRLTQPGIDHIGLHVSASSRTILQDLFFFFFNYSSQNERDRECLRHRCSHRSLSSEEPLNNQRPPRV